MCSKTIKCLFKTSTNLGSSIGTVQNKDAAEVLPASTAAFPNKTLTVEQAQNNIAAAAAATAVPASVAALNMPAHNLAAQPLTHPGHMHGLEPPARSTSHPHCMRLQQLVRTETAWQLQQRLVLSTDDEKVLLH